MWVIHPMKTWRGRENACEELKKKKEMAKILFRNKNATAEGRDL